MTDISRRAFTGSAVAIPFLPSALQAQALPPGNAGVAAANDASGHLTIAVEVNGRGPLHFVVDTGADRSVLADTTAEALGLTSTGQVMLAGIVRTVRAESVVVESIAFGPISRRRLSLPVLPRSQLLADGYIGLDMLDEYRVVLDFAQHRLTVTDPMPITLSVYHPSDVHVLHAQGSDGHLRTASCSVDGVSVAAFIDTGAESSMGNEALYRRLLDFNPSIASTKTIELIGLTGGAAVGRVISVHEVTMGRISVTDCPIAIADLQVFDIWGLAERPALVIGMNWLRHFKRVEIDYGRKDLRFEIGNTGFTHVV